MKPPKSKYDKSHPAWLLGSDNEVQVFWVAADEAVNEIGIHLTGDPALTSPEFEDAMCVAERDNFPRIFLHKLPSNVVSFQAFVAKRSA